MNFFKNLLFSLLVVGCLSLSSCLRIEDISSARASITPDSRVEGQWRPLKWMDQENPNKALITLTKIERDGSIGYIFKSTDDEQQKDIENLWGMDFDGVRFLISDYPDDKCKSCQVLNYNFKDNKIYVYVLRTEEAQAFINKFYPENNKVQLVNTSELFNEIVIKKLDKEAKAILKDLAAHPELWENAVILEKV